MNFFKKNFARKYTCAAAQCINRGYQLGLIGSMYDMCKAGNKYYIKDKIRAPLMDPRFILLEGRLKSDCVKIITQDLSIMFNVNKIVMENLYCGLAGRYPQTSNEEDSYLGFAVGCYLLFTVHNESSLLTSKHLSLLDKMDPNFQYSKKYKIIKDK